MQPLPAWSYPYLGAFLIGLSKAGFATGLGMLTTPLVATAVPPRQAIGLILPLLCFADLFTLSAFWKKWDVKLIRAPFWGALVGIALGMAVVNQVSERMLRVSIGATALILTALLIMRNLWYPQRAWRPSLAASILTGTVAGDRLCAEEHARLTDRRADLLCHLTGELRRRFPPMRDYTERQHEATLEDLAFLLDFLSAAVFVGDARLLTSYLDFTVGVLASRDVPPETLDLALSALPGPLHDLPRSLEVLAAGRRRLAERGFTYPD